VIPIGQRVRLTIDQDRYSSEDLAYLLREGHGDWTPLDGGTFVIGEYFEATLPTPHLMYTLYEERDDLIVKAYLAEENELEVVDG